MVSVVGVSETTARSRDVRPLASEVNVTFSVLFSLEGEDEVITAVLSRKEVTISPVTPSSGVNKISLTVGASELDMASISVL